MSLSKCCVCGKKGNYKGKPKLHHEIFIFEEPDQVVMKNGMELRKTVNYTLEGFFCISCLRELKQREKVYNESKEFFADMED